ncbi:MAG: hypothetical protein I8H75_06045 [Myxococcaceae bacterium]|nr:hypothetical protein [Myxococcaceae bacterium]MBH2006877.1 hypothetical protein [Myxococcaceae bacterium]
MKNNFILARLFFVFLIANSLFVSSEAKAGEVCWPACCIACTAVGASSFAKQYGLVYDIQGCAPMCMVACAATIFIPAACFSKKTQIKVLHNKEIVENKIENITSGDMVLTVKNKKPSWTKVLRNIRTEGQFEFIRITLQGIGNDNHSEVMVTPEHGLILVQDNGDTSIDSAENLVIGDKMIGSSGEIFLVMNLARIVLNEKYTLETIDGTVLASDLFITTLCSNEVVGGERPFESTMKDWRLKHNFSET